MTTDQALLKLGESTADAVQRALELLAPDAVERGPAAVVPRDSAPLSSIPLPAVAVHVSYIDGVTGGNVFVMSRAGARRLAAAMVGDELPPVDPNAELTELDVSAVGEAMNQMMAAAANATGTVLGQAVQISAPEIHFFGTAAEATQAFEQTPYATAVSFSLHAEPCRLIQLVPNSFIVRMTRALAELEAELVGDNPGAGKTLSADAMRGIPVRVWAELGRTRMPLGQAVGLPPGSVLELEKLADEPLDLYVNGRRFASGRLQLSEGTDWAVRIEAVYPIDDSLSPASEGAIV